MTLDTENKLNFIFLNNLTKYKLLNITELDTMLATLVKTQKTRVLAVKIC
jgi:hypothetical protein